MVKRTRFPGIMGPPVRKYSKVKKIKTLPRNLRKPFIRLKPGERHEYRKQVTPSGYRRIRFRQTKLLDFIGIHFNGNVSKCARFLDMAQPELARIIDKGLFGRVVIERIARGFSKLDPSVTPRSLFIFPEFVKIPRKTPENLPEPILPTLGGFSSNSGGLFSRILDKYK